LMYCTVSHGSVPLLAISHFEHNFLMLRRFVSKITSCIITLYHLRSFVPISRKLELPLIRTLSGFTWRFESAGVNCNKSQPEFKAFSQARVHFPARCPHHLL